MSLTYNKGGAMGTSLGGSTFYLITSLIVLVIVLYLAYRNLNVRFISISLAAIAGGAIGNIADRIRVGQVIDFLDFNIPDIKILGFALERWWTFNLADAAITVGVITFIVYMLFHRKGDTPDAISGPDAVNP